MGIIAIIIVLGFIAFLIWGMFLNAEDEKRAKEIMDNEKEQNSNKVQKFLEDINNEQKNHLQLYVSIAENNFIVNLKCPIKVYNAYSSALRKEENSRFDHINEQNIKCYINLVEDYFYIIPVNIKENECKYNFKHYVYHILEDYRRLAPNYKNLFFKIHINDIKFYKQNGTVYANTQGNIGSEYAWGNLILTGDSEYRTKGSISTSLKDTRTTEFYYNDNGIIKTLIFDGEALTKLQLIIPDKEKK